MKSLPVQLYYFMRHRPSRKNVYNLVRFLIILAILVTIYSIIFHYLMAMENRYYSWATGFYWTLTVMSTLGFGDITFNSDLGRIFSILVLLSGILLLLVLFPFTFIEFFYTPWIKAQSAARAPRELPKQIRDHVILTHYDVVTGALISRLNQYHYPYVLLVPDLTEALNLHDLGFKVVVGELDNPETYHAVRADTALLVATTANDMVNSNVAFTVREVADQVPIIATANFEASVDILELAGSSYVLRLGEMMGQALARRAISYDARAHIIGQFDQLLIAEAAVARTPLVNQTLRASQLREQTGVNVIGIWERGKFAVAGPDTRLGPTTILVLAGSQEQFDAYDKLFGFCEPITKPVVIIGGGRVGRAAGRSLIERGLDYRIVEQLPERIRDPEKYVLGNAAQLEILEQAGLMETPIAIITTHDDDTNIYLTIYCRRLRPDIQIISRATLERNVVTLHRAGADFVMSYASMGANAIMNLLNRSNILMVAEGLNIFGLKIPPTLAGQTIAETSIRRETGCHIVALKQDDRMLINPDPTLTLPAKAEMILIGTVEAEERFLEEYGDHLGVNS